MYPSRNACPDFIMMEIEKENLVKRHDLFLFPGKKCLKAASLLKFLVCQIMKFDVTNMQKITENRKDCHREDPPPPPRHL